MAAIMGPIANADRIFFKTLLDGDWSKFKGTSNRDPGAGGGARDLRFNGLGQKAFLIIANQLFPTITREMRDRDGPVLLDIYNGKIRFGFGPNDVENAAFESPTEARDAEWRLTQVKGKQPMSSATQVAGAHKDIIVLAQQSNGEVWAEFSTLATVSAVAGPQFTQFIHSVVQKPRDPRWAAVGYWDVVNNLTFSN